MLRAAAKVRAPETARNAGGAGRTGPDALYESHFAFVWRNLKRFGVPPNLLEDATQDVFLTVHRRWESYSEQRSTVETWLFGIVIRVARYHRRTLARRLSRIIPWGSAKAEAEPVSETEGPAEEAMKRQAVELLDSLLAALDEHKREMVVLVDVEQCTVPQASEILGINVNTAYWRLRAGRAEFERALQRWRASAARRRHGGEQS